MDDQTPAVGRPRGAAWRALEAEGIVWEGQVLIAGDELDLAARLIVTEQRLGFARGGAVALDVPRDWLRPAPALNPDSTIRLSISPDGVDADEILILVRDGRRAASYLVSLLTGAGARPVAAARPVTGDRLGLGIGRAFPDQELAPPRLNGEPFGESLSAPMANHVSRPLPEQWESSNGRPSLAVLDRDDFPPVMPSSPTERSQRSFEGERRRQPIAEPVPLPAWRQSAAEPPPPARPMPAATNGATPHTAWLQPIDLGRPRQSRQGWAIRLSGLILLLIVAAAFGTGRLPDNPGRDLASRLPASTRDTLGIAESDPPTPTSEPTRPPALTPTATVPPTEAPAVADANTGQPTAPPEPTAWALGVGGDATEIGTGTESATATATATPPPTPVPPEPTATPTEEPLPTATTAPTEAVIASDQEEEPAPTFTPTPEPEPTPIPEPEPTATSEPTQEPTAEPEPDPTSTPTETPTAPPTETPLPVPTSTAEPTATATATATATESPTATVTATPSPSPSPSPEPTPTPGRIPPQAASVGAEETPEPVVANGAFRHTIESAVRGAELPGLALPATGDGEWVVLLVFVQNWSDEATTMAMSDFQLAVLEPVQAVSAVDSTSGAVAQFLGFVPAYKSNEAVLFAPGEGHRLALVFLVNPEATRLQLLTGETGIDLDGIVSGEGAVVGPVDALPVAALLEGTVVEVIDGQTILVEVDGEQGLVRYSGIAGPTGDDCYAAEATEANRALVEGQTVWLERQRFNTAGEDVLTRDVWVATEDGSWRLAAAALVAEGAAVPSIREPDTRFAAWLAAARGQAESAGAGLWSACDGS